jgi:diadenosine tetraphosphatase ApaH/serine/threonine PP2A family protein phosphatase
MKAAPSKRRSSLLPRAKKARTSVSRDPFALVHELVAHLKARTVRDGKCGAPWPRKDAIKLIRDASSLMAQQEPLVHLTLPCKSRLAIVGDLHGQFDDLMRILELHGDPSEERQYLFNGDFVDRGANGVEVLLIIFAWKVAAPNWVHINRGNHEDLVLNLSHGFYREVMLKYDQEMFNIFQMSFSKMPVAHIIEDAVLVVHGGLPRNMASLEDIAKIERENDSIEPPGIMHDLLWSDPSEGIAEFGPNSLRGGDGVVFGAAATKAYLEANGLSLLIRSHQRKSDGWEVGHDGLVVTVFSAADYGGSGNEAAILELCAKGTDQSPGVVLRKAGDLPNLGALVVRTIGDKSSFEGPPALSALEPLAPPVPPRRRITRRMTMDKKARPPLQQIDSEEDKGQKSQVECPSQPVPWQEGMSKLSDLLDRMNPKGSL